MNFPFLLSIQLAVYSIAKPVEDSSREDFGAFPALSNLISEFSHGWTNGFSRLLPAWLTIANCLSVPPGLTQDHSRHH